MDPAMVPDPNAPTPSPSPDPAVSKIEQMQASFETHVDMVAAATKKLIDAGCGAAIAAETSLKLWIQHFVNN